VDGYEVCDGKPPSRVVDGIGLFVEAGNSSLVLAVESEDKFAWSCRRVWRQSSHGMTIKSCGTKYSLAVTVPSARIAPVSVLPGGNGKRCCPVRQKGLTVALEC